VGLRFILEGKANNEFEAKEFANDAQRAKETYSKNGFQTFQQKHLMNIKNHLPKHVRLVKNKMEIC